MQKAKTLKSAAAIAPIRTAILRLDPESSTFTSTHLTFARLCLEAKAYPEALPVLEKPITYFPMKDKTGQNSLYPFLCSKHQDSSTFIKTDTDLSAKLSHQDILQYLLYGAMIFMAMKDWSQALLFLEGAIVAPVAGSASKIQVEAYKKWVLVNLLESGSVRLALSKSEALANLRL